VHLIGFNVVAFDFLVKLCGDEGCYACALDVLPDCVEAVIWRFVKKIVLRGTVRVEYLPACGTSL
jgi:hypothetical protein